MADEVSLVDDPSPTRTNSQSEPASATRSTGMGNGGSDWTNTAAPHQGSDVHKTMQGLALGDINNNPFISEGSGTGTGYVNSEASASVDTGLSPDAQSNSSRPTPNSSTGSDSRSNLQPGQSASGTTSYETSPAASGPRVPTTDGRLMGSFFANQPDYSSIPSSGMTPDNSAFALPETPGRVFDVPPGWEMSQQTTGLTPVGEGVFRQLMGLGPMDPM
jgi:hypothetical protein